MNKLLGTAPKHPGLWRDEHFNSAEVAAPTSINTVRSTSHGQDELSALAPQLATLSKQGRWIVLINPPHIHYKQMLANAGVQMDKVLLVHSKDEVETLWATEKALTNGTSSAVVTWINDLDQRDNRRLQLVAKSARALGLVIQAQAETSTNPTSFAVSNMVSPATNFTSFH
ncbi:cell division inhibitor SulA [Shewanella maritima]|uniref:cell division inhibitor SulA n=1 Tax=Shewanella maritima TaxID=2520507 RepID=UPI0037355714